MANSRSISMGRLRSASMRTIFVSEAATMTSRCTASKGSACRAHNASADAPSRGKSRASCRPSPCEAPVIKIFLPINLFIIKIFLYKVSPIDNLQTLLCKENYLEIAMAPANRGPDQEKTRRRIVKLLKTEGALDSMTLGARLGGPAMAVRQHLYALQDQRLVIAKERPVPLGRPAKYWELTREADRLFPEAYAELSVSLIGALNDAFGAEGLQRILERRTARQQGAYSARISSTMSLRRKLQTLAAIRTE